MVVKTIKKLKLDDLEGNIRFDEVESEKVGGKQQKTILYCIIDRKKHGLVSYMRENGLNISYVYTSIEQAKNSMLIEDNPTRLIILDTGTGRFSAVNVRKELIDLMGICDEDTRITVFYVDSAIKGDWQRDLGKNKTRFSVDWVQYSGTESVIKKVMSYKEGYMLSPDAEESDIVTGAEREMALQFKGPEVEGKNNVKDNIIKIDINEFQDSLGTSDKLLPKYNIRT